MVPSAPSAPTAARRAARLLDGAAAAVAVLYLVMYAAIALLRMSYPFDLEWMEGGMLAQVGRVLRGQPLYVAPSLSYIPFDYTPLYFLVASLPARLMGEGLAALRLTSFVCSLGCLGLVAWLVARETRSRSAALLAAGLFAATYRHSGAWLDLARPDSLFLLLVLAGFAVYRVDGRGARGGALAGALFAIAFLAKQTALVIAAPLAVLALRDGWRRGAAFAGTLAALVLLSTLLLDRMNGGWYHYYVFGVAGGHGIERGLLLRFWTDDLLRPLALAVVLGATVFALPARDESPGARAFLLALAAGLLGAAWWLRAYRVVYDNALIPACAGVAVLAGVGWHAIRERARGAEPETAAGIAAALGLAVLAQFALLAYDPIAQLPTAADRAAGQALIEHLKRAPGDLLVPSHPDLAVRAGRPAHFHEVALTDVLERRGHGGVERALADSLDRALREHRWAALLLDNRDWLSDDAEPYYVAGWPAFDNDTVFWSRTGMLTRPQAVLLPRPAGAPAARPDSLPPAR